MFSLSILLTYQLIGHNILAVHIYVRTYMCIISFLKVSTFEMSCTTLSFTHATFEFSCTTFLYFLTTKNACSKQLLNVQQLRKQSKLAAQRSKRRKSKGYLLKVTFLKVSDTTFGLFST